MTILFILILFSLNFSTDIWAESVPSPNKIPDKIYVYGSEAIFDFRLHHTVAVVKAALKVNAEKLGNIEVHSTGELDLWMNRSRALKSLQQNNDRIHVISSFASIDLDKKFLPVRISIAASTLGERVFLIRPQDRKKFESISSLKELKNFTFGVGQDWIDGDIMQAAGLRVERSTKYELLFSMLQARRFDLLTRAAHEAWDELRTRGFQNIDWEGTWLLTYPAPFYLYVNKNQQALAKRLTQGLQELEANGTLGRLYVEHFGPALLRSYWEGRKRFAIKNPYLPTKPPIGYTNWDEWKKQADQSLQLWSQEAKKRFRPAWSETYRPKNPIKSDRPLKKPEPELRLRAADHPNDTHMLGAMFAIKKALHHEINQKSDYFQRPVRYLINPALDQKTALEALNKDDRQLDIIATQSSKEREKHYLTAQVDIAQGLIGTRILVVLEENRQAFEKVKNLKDLQKFRICVGRDWPDRKVLENASIPIYIKLTINELYDALEKKHCDGITRAIYEVRDELLSRPTKPFTADPYLILSYPASQQLFIAKSHSNLATTLEKGLKELEKEGVLDEIIDLAYGDSIRHVELKDRTVIQLTNPVAPKWLQQESAQLQNRQWFY
ncbi:MAG: hypothetical protein ACOH5I_15155 [Oligoflexus sp.]